MLFVKSRRAQSKEDYETWLESEVSNTLNTFDIGDIRTTTLIVFSPRYDEVVRLHDSKIAPTVATYYGTGGNNMPFIAFPIQDGRDMQKNQNGLGIGSESDPSYTLDRTGAQSIAIDKCVRRLTPTECERLQGFPDNWTGSQSDTQRYKQMGNAVTVNVIEWIGSRL